MDNWVRAARDAMRVRFEIAIAPNQACDSLAAAEEALGEIDRVESRLSAYLPGSDIWEINHAEPRRPVKVQVSTIAFLTRARELSLDTGGAFDPTVGPLMRLYFENVSAPTETEIADALDCVGIGRVIGIDFDKQTVWRTRDCVRIDPGAMGKGWALDRAASILEESGVTSALLHAGTSSVRTIGVMPGGEPFRVAVADPSDPEKTLATVALSPGKSALGVSAPHGKWKSTSGEIGYGVENFPGDAIGHVIDPRTGGPTRALRLAAAVCESAAVADALSTALLILGSDAVDDLRARFPGADFLAFPA